MKRLLIIFSMAFSLQGCIFVVGAAAGAAAIAAVYDHRPVNESLDDIKIANKIADKIRAVPELRNEAHVNVTVFNGITLLTGEAPNSALKQQAEEIAHDTQGVTKVYNAITFQGPTSSLSRTSDSWITAKIKSQMLASDALKTNSSSIKVVTENGTVYLMGIVTKDQANTAVDIAREVSGVQKVIKIFQIRN
jgi:osmotically-inducible protein OsmY